MAFREERLPVMIERGALGGPRFNTTVLPLESGHEQRNQNWQEALQAFNLSYGLRKKDDRTALAGYDTIRAFFYKMRGRAFGFRFKDWTDFQINNQLIGTGDGTQTAYQVFKRYGAVATSFYDRDIRKLVSGTLTVFINNVEFSSANYAVDNNTGIITFTTAPTVGQAISVTCEFDVPVRFDSDAFDLQAQYIDAVSIPTVMLYETRAD